ncbi:hypothetical protein KC19_8G167300 [Ceratodon purpureus]|uniref:X8 domain-containing protein n=1 Tax=Ceratodon purpureus TaxID=3225 RepID=A0A8T0H7S3_CERPU|nr:hypothetical protein KC19_8G167300 [Ceratodon purpureus]
MGSEQLFTLFVVMCRWVAVGNEPFLTGYNGSYLNSTLPALRNIVNALQKAGQADTVKAIIPFNADILDGAALPSQTRFKVEYLDQILPMLQIFNNTNAPFSVNLYPFISKYQNPDFPLDFAFFMGTTSPVNDPPNVYNNALDASLDALIAALRAAGYPNMPVLLGEIGWPTDGNEFATVALAGQYNQQLINHLQSNVGTPLRPGVFTEFYMFGLLDENIKSILPGPYERHWGMFFYDGVAKYDLNLAAGTNAAVQTLQSAEYPPYMSAQYCVLNTFADMTNLTQNVDFACSRSDCTPLYPGSSCAFLTPEQNASYSFNAYFQFQNQDPNACNFQGLAKITAENPSVGTCRFPIGLVKYTPAKNPNSGSSPGVRNLSTVLVVTVFTLLLNTLFCFV